MPPVYFLLIGGGGESIVPASHKVVFGEDSMCSEWIPDPVQRHAAYCVERFLTAAGDLWRLSAADEGSVFRSLDRKRADLFYLLQEFYLLQDEKVALSVQFFPGMPELLEQVQTRCGLEIERI